MEFETYTGKPNIKRLLRAFKREEVDRVPNFEVLIENSHVEKILGRKAGNTLASVGNPAKGIADPLEVIPMDPVDYIEICNTIGQDTTLIEAIWTPFRKEDSSGKLILVSDRSIKNKKDFHKLVMPSEKDIEPTLRYLRNYKKALKGTNIGVSVLFGTLFTTLYEFVVGMNDFMIACYEDVSFIEEMLEVSTDYWVSFCEAIIGEGVDFIWPADDVAFKTGLFLPPKLLRRLWIPRMSHIIEPALEKGIPVLFHSDGKIDDIVEDLIKMGIDCLNPMDPYGIDYREYKKRYGSKLALFGNIDIEFPLSKGTPQDVDRDVREHMEVLKPGYGYVAGSSHSIVDYIPHENFITMINAIHKYGKY